MGLSRTSRSVAIASAPKQSALQGTDERVEFRHADCAKSVDLTHAFGPL